jgi:hypothetical protein
VTTKRVAVHTPAKNIIVDTRCGINSPDKVAEKRSALKNPRTGQGETKQADEGRNSEDRVPQCFEMMRY